MKPIIHILSFVFGNLRFDCTSILEDTQWQRKTNANQIFPIHTNIRLDERFISLNYVPKGGGSHETGSPICARMRKGDEVENFPAIAKEGAHNAFTNK